MVGIRCEGGQSANDWQNVDMSKFTPHRVEDPLHLSSMNYLSAGYSNVFIQGAKVNVRWQAIDGFENVDDHIDPWTEKKNGKRIFPCFKDPDDTLIRHKLELIVQLSPGYAGKAVFVKAFDVDDNTSEAFDLDEHGLAPVVDTNGKAGDDNLTDYLGTPKTGQFWTGSAWGSNTAQGTVDTNGEAKFIFRVGMQPGNNYRVVASVIDESMYAGIQTQDAEAAKFLGPRPEQTGGAFATPLLTVWRKLWVENDSMEAIPIDQFGYKRNDLSADTANPIINEATVDAAGTGTLFYISPINDPTSFIQLENGHIIVQSTEHRVTGSGILIDDHVVGVLGDYTSVPVSSGFRLYDDDDFGLEEEPLPRLDLVDDLMKSFFQPSFIEVTDAADFNLRKTVPFKKNDDLQSSTVVNSSKDLSEQDALWVCQLTAAYQFSQEEDGDPNDEDPTYGGTRRFDDYDHSTVFVEACREEYESTFRLVEQGGSTNLTLTARNKLKDYITAISTHEMGHHPGNLTGDEEHAEMGIMREGGPDPGNPGFLEFSPKSILRFRESKNWSKKQ
jgi:hypothetical protein